MYRSTVGRGMKEHLAVAHRVDLAAAWIRHSAPLSALLDFVGSRSGHLRVIAGIDRSITEPAALREIMRVGHLRIGRQATGLFHVKFYLYRLRDKTIGWIGSSNLTGGGFETNDELVYEFVDDCDAAHWFEGRWAASLVATPELIQEYEGGYQEPAASSTAGTTINQAKGWGDTRTNSCAGEWPIGIPTCTPCNASMIIGLLQRAAVSASSPKRGAGSIACGRVSLPLQRTRPS